MGLAADQLTNYLLSDDGEIFLLDLKNSIIEAADSLGIETLSYIFEASRAVTINNEVEAARVLQSLLSEEDNSVRYDRLRKSIVEALPEPTPKMKQSWRILNLLGAGGSNSDPSKMVPVVRKLSQEPK